MAALTGDQRVSIRTSQTFFDRVGDVLRKKAEYWKETATPNRTDVNRQMQKRKRFANNLLSTTAADSLKQQAAQYWLTYYETDPAVLDANGIPTYDSIFNSFDVTYDFFAGVVSGDSSLTEIDW